MKAFNLIAKWFNSVETPTEHAALVRGEQIEAFKKALPVGLIATAANASIIIGFCLLNGGGWPIAIWATAIVITIAIGIPAAINAYKSQKVPRPRPRSHLRRSLKSSVLFGFVWALGAILLLPGASVTQQILITTVSAGMMCGGAYIFSTVPRAALAFVGIIATGFGIGIVMSDFGRGTLAIILLLVSYTLFMFKSAYWNYSNYVRAWLQQIELNEQKAELGQQNDVINLLLKDFEQTASDCLWETNADAELLRINEALAERLNIPLDSELPSSFANLLISGGADKQETLHIFGVAANNTFFRDLLLPLKTDDGERWLSFSGKRKADDGYRGVVADVTDARKAEEQIRHMAHFDSLTELANRDQLSIEIDDALETSETDDKGFALLYLDLDRFKLINDAHGHQFGDEVLVACADRMRRCIGDRDVAARVGGDEFTIVQRGGGHKKSAEMLAQRLIKALERPIQIGDLTVQISASVGVALCPRDGKNTDELMKRADLALYRAKNAGRACVCFFESNMDEEASERREIETDLRTAIREGQFKLFYQPLVDGQSKEAIGFEALLRWKHPTRGLVAPENFIGIAEQTGMITHIGEWVIREALQEAACWPDEQGISINLSPIQVKSSKLLPTVVNALAASGIAPERLEFEITESVLLDDSDASLKTLQEIHKLGVRISLDDFGTGYSSLSYLRSFPFDKIKIDKSFVQSIGDSTECRAIVRAVASLADSLGMRSTAEGLETKEQIDSVMAEGCTELQGFFFSEPLSAETLEKTGILRRNPRDKAAEQSSTRNLTDETTLPHSPDQDASTPDKRGTGS